MSVILETILVVMLVVLMFIAIVLLCFVSLWIIFDIINDWRERKND